MKFINERLGNKKEAKYQLKKITRKLSEFMSPIGDMTEYYINSMSYKIFDNDKIPIIKKILDSLSKKYIRNNLYLTYSVDKNHLNLYLKDIFSYRKKPPRYLYHATFKNHVKSILENGLIPKKSQNYTDASINHPELIFATEENRKYWGDYIFKIDTKGLPNKWWYDLNFSNQSKAYMTNVPIPPSHLEYLDYNASGL